MKGISGEDVGVELHSSPQHGGGDFDSDARFQEPPRHHKPHRRRTVWLERIFLACSLIGVAVLTAMLIIGRSQDPDCGEKHEEPAAPFDPVSELIGLVDTTKLRDNLHALSIEAHVAGSLGDVNTVATVQKAFEGAGLETTLDEYEVLLNWPVDEATFVTLLQDGQSPINATLKEDPVDSDPVTKKPRFGAFHGYAKPGKASGPIVYANYGRKEDFQALSAAGVSCTGAIVMVRYGKIFRGNKVALAEAAGAQGVIIYSDPADDGFLNGEVYPEGPWRSNSSFQRGSVFTGEGDPLTPHFPATPGALRLTNAEASQVGADGWALPNIPSLPMSYADAAPILRAMRGSGKPASALGNDWPGGLNLEYYTGPTNSSVTLSMGIEMDTRVRPIWNVLGTIRGHEEPDRMVILGNHRDAWVAGGVDPISGSCVLVELARAFGAMAKKGWKPRRTIVFASWDAEEYALIGSTEYVERLVNVLDLEAVAYLNVDMAVSSVGPIKARASPALTKAMYAATKKVLQPACPFKNSNALDSAIPPTLIVFCHDLQPTAGESMYDFWVRNHQQPGSDPPRPAVPPLGAGSDFTAFQQFVGVSSIDIEVRGTPDLGDYYAVYHSVYDSYTWITRFVDPDFLYHAAVAQVWGSLAIDLADSLVLPLEYQLYAESVAGMISTLQTVIDGSSQVVKDALNPMMPRLQDELRHFTNASMFVEKARHAIQAAVSSDSDLHSFRKSRALNDGLMAGERSFILPEGLPGRAWDKHVLFTPSATNSYGASIFPGVTDALAEGDTRLAQRQLDVICHLLARSTNVLQAAARAVLQ